MRVILFLLSQIAWALDSGSYSWLSHKTVLPVQVISYEWSNPEPDPLDLLTLASRLREASADNCVIVVIGHSDSKTKSPDANQRTSDRRAQIVTDWIRRHLGYTSVVPLGRSDHDKLIEIQGPEPRNRRCEVFVLPR